MLLSAPTKSGIPAADRLLENTLRKYCKSNIRSNYQWQAWENTLNPLVKEYWLASIHRCQGRPLQAIEELKSVAPSLAAQPSTRGLAIVAYEQLVELLRFNSQRAESASYYKKLVRLWKESGVSAKTMGLSKQKFLLRRINDFLWASRYLAYVGNYSLARRFVDEATQLIANVSSDLGYSNRKLRKELAEFSAEAHFILASRISLERKEYRIGKSHLQKNSYFKLFTSRGKVRALWYLGLFHYLEKDYAKSLGYWQKVLLTTKERDVKEKSMFWLALVLDKQGKGLESADIMQRLREFSPLSFYSVVAPVMAQMEAPEYLPMLFGDVNNLMMRINSNNEYKIASIRNNSRLSAKLLRTEIFISAGLKKWSALAALDLYKDCQRSLPLKQNKEVFIYLSRLLYAAGLYHESMGVTELLEENFHVSFWDSWPEQLLVYFPKPYADIFRQRADESAINVSLYTPLQDKKVASKLKRKVQQQLWGLCKLFPVQDNH